MDWALAAGSLAAVLVLAGIAWALGLGGSVRIEDAAQAGRLAEDAIPGFSASDAVVDAAGAAALVFGAGDSVALIRQSGARFLIREVRGPTWRVTDDRTIDIDAGDRVPVRLRIDQPGLLGARLDATADKGVSNVRV